MESEDTASQQPEGSLLDRASQCPRCGGLLVLTYYQDILEDSGETTIPALRCAICGEIIDPVILANRQLPAPNLLYGTKERQYGRQIVPSTHRGTARLISRMK